MNRILFHQEDVDFRFLSEIAPFFGLTIRVCGGNFSTHEIDCSQADLDALLALWPDWWPTK